MTEKKHLPLWRAMAQEIIAAVGEIPVVAAALKNNRPLPLAIGIGPQLEEIARQRGADDDAALALHIALSRYCSSFEYLSAVATDGATRHAVDGSMSDTVSAEHKDHAIRNLALRDKKRRQADEQAAYERGVVDGRAAAKAEAEKPAAAAPEPPASAAPAKKPVKKPDDPGRPKLSLGAEKLPLGAAARLHKYGVGVGA
ncbi:MAG: hypothetical protein JOY71_29780 [Acetobacteraceae bacterium]|nr:hypothetical protein [Acetobacteraceae bacterium]